ncbi:hypothetical protein KFK09_023658 [Dendrobium nobile]|uniref:Uncharacterized protein n=1 Tax=Dendrobium nobile TaxID=94219 RepID=A0A8T3ABK5_DENNO|nr:hypothetical protein KFK09_023658 [Dendrobium nobile]
MLLKNIRKKSGQDWRTMAISKRLHPNLRKEKIVPNVNVAKENEASLGPINVADDSILDQQKWANADIVKISDEVVVVLQEGENPLSDNVKMNGSTKEDDVLFLEAESSATESLVGENNNGFQFFEQFNCDAFTDTEIEINAKCYARMDNNLSFTKSRGKRGKKPRNVILLSPRNTRSHTAH